MSRLICAVFLSLTLVTMRAEGQPPNQPHPNQPDLDRIPPGALRGMEPVQVDTRIRKVPEGWSKSFVERQPVLFWVVVLAAAVAWSLRKDPQAPPQTSDSSDRRPPTAKPSTAKPPFRGGFPYYTEGRRHRPDGPRSEEWPGA
jgi:hypothetical protein